MKNGLFMIAMLAGALAVAVACPAGVRDQVAEAAQLPERYQIEADRQLTMFVNWVRDDAVRPTEDVQDRDLN